MRTVILINSNAARVRRAPKLIEQIRDACPGARVIATSSVGAVENALADLAEDPPDRLLTVGGDGTFRLAIDWVRTLRFPGKVSIASVGGGQFCYMTRYSGFPSVDPLRNLRAIWRGSVRLEQRLWSPIEVRDVASGLRYHAAVYCDGVIAQFIERYDREGKGSIGAVVRMLWGLVCEVALGRGSPPRGFAPVPGYLAFDRRRADASMYVGCMVGSINRFLPLLTPFVGTPLPEQVFALAYWGSYASLAPAIPFIWFGIPVPWMRMSMYNAPAHEVHVRARQSQIVLDGDLVALPGSGERTLTIRLAEPIVLLHAL